MKKCHGGVWTQSFDIKNLKRNACLVRIRGPSPGLQSSHEAHEARVAKHCPWGVTHKDGLQDEAKHRELDHHPGISGLQQ